MLKTPSVLVLASLFTWLSLSTFANPDPGSPLPMRVGRKAGYIDKSGKVVITPSFDGAWSCLLYTSRCV